MSKSNSYNLPQQELLRHWFVKKIFCIVNICLPNFKFNQGGGTEINQLQSQTNSTDIYSKMKLKFILVSELGLKIHLKIRIPIILQKMWNRTKKYITSSFLGFFSAGPFSWIRHNVIGRGTLKKKRKQFPFPLNT